MLVGCYSVHDKDWAAVAGEWYGHYFSHHRNRHYSLFEVLRVFDFRLPPPMTVIAMILTMWFKLSAFYYIFLSSCSWPLLFIRWFNSLKVIAHCYLPSQAQLIPQNNYELQIAQHTHTHNHLKRTDWVSLLTFAFAAAALKRPHTELYRVIRPYFSVAGLRLQRIERRTRLSAGRSRVGTDGEQKLLLVNCLKV